ncbi:MAG TPA: GNAT family protein, partial [Longimicrobium sp.]|nr:GNAT family protein [Longimicrobium sp.]
MNTPPYRIVTPRTVIRCYQPDDAEALQAAITASVEHLTPWMPWAHAEPEELEAKVQRLRGFRGRFDLDQDYVYAIFSPDESGLIGGTGLHPRVGPDALEIGYWILVDEAGKGYATEVSAALTRVAFEISGARRVEIRCDPANLPSAAVPRKLGFVHEATLRCRSTTETGAPRDVMMWSMFPDTFPGTPASSAELRAYDAAGRRVL